MRTGNRRKIKWRKVLIITFDALAVKKESLEEENKKMLVEIGKLRSPERVGKVAINDLNMVRSPDTKVIFLEKQK
jgi:cell division protein FtsL